MMKLIDFGNVTDLGEVPLKEEAYNKFSGTAYYLSPFTLEIEKGMTHEDLAPILKANDYWAMALTFVKYMTGKEWTDLLKYKPPEDVFLRNTNSYIHDRLMLWKRPEEYIKDDCKYRAAVIQYFTLFFKRCGISDTDGSGSHAASEYSAAEYNRHIESTLSLGTGGI